MLELKEGQFAIIAKGNVNNNNVGKIVYLHKHLGEFENHIESYEDAWVVICVDEVEVATGPRNAQTGVIEADRLIAINSKFVGSVK